MAAVPECLGLRPIGRRAGARPQQESAPRGVGWGVPPPGMGVHLVARGRDHFIFAAGPDHHQLQPTPSFISVTIRKRIVLRTVKFFQLVYLGIIYTIYYILYI